MDDAPDAAHELVTVPPAATVREKMDQLFAANPEFFSRCDPSSWFVGFLMGTGMTAKEAMSFYTGEN